MNLSRQQKFGTQSLVLSSYLLSALCGVAVLAINYNIANVYRSADGKTRALFGLIEWSFLYQYYLVIPLTIALVLGLVCYRSSGKKQALRAILLASSVGILLALRVWRLMC
jgi:hypothetical protein